MVSKGFLIALIISASLFVLLFFAGIKYIKKYSAKEIRIMYFLGMLFTFVATVYFACEYFLPKGKIFSFGMSSYVIDDGNTTDESTSSNYIDNDLNKENEEIYLELSQDIGNYGENAYFIIVKGTEISFQEQGFESFDEFEDYIRNVNYKDHVLYIIDSYADSAAMHEVLDIVDEYKIDYSLEFR